MKLAMIVASCTDDAAAGGKIPCMLFESVEAAEAFMAEVFGEDSQDKYGHWGSGDSYERRATVGEKFFTSHWEGDDFVEHYDIQVVEFGAPFIEFSG